MVDTARDGDDMAGEVMRRWIWGPDGASSGTAGVSWKNIVNWDGRIAFGSEKDMGEVARL